MFAKIVILTMKIFKIINGEKMNGIENIEARIKRLEEIENNGKCYILNIWYGEKAVLTTPEGLIELTYTDKNDLLNQAEAISKGFQLICLNWETEED